MNREQEQKSYKKVTLRERTASHVTYGVLLVITYWELFGRDWHDWNKPVRLAVLIAVGGYSCFLWVRSQQYREEKTDEMARQNLLRADSLTLKVEAVLMVVLAFAGALGVLSATGMGYGIVLSVLAGLILRAAAFWVMDTRGV